jgi:hypothetical protein
MAVNATYYLDAASLSLATAVYLDSSLSLIAPNGFYADGTVVRQQSSGVLLSFSTPDLCSAPCGTSINAPGSQGFFSISSNLGDDIGAIVIEFVVQSVPDGFRATYNGTTYNKLSSNVDGLHQSATPGNFTVVGDPTATGTCSSWYPSGGTVVLNEYVYDGGFVATGNTTSTTIVTGDISLTAGGPEMCIMVIPKLAASPNLINLQIFGGCTSTGWTAKVKCPALLPSFPASTIFATGTIPCSTAMDQTYYFAKVHLAIDSYVGLYDYVFTDANGQFPLATGYYLTSNVASPNKVIRVTNGLITGITNCV